MMLMRVQASVRRQHGLLSGARSLRRVARSLSPAGYKHQVSAPSNDWSNHVPNTTKNGFNALGLVQPIVDGIAAQGENLVLSASTGSGKTLAYTLPVLHHLLVEEQRGYKRLHQRPRCLVLVPTRELASQVLEEVKQLSHFAKVSSCAVLGGESYNIQKRVLKGKVDLVVACPGRLVQHEKLKNLELQEVTHIVIDEVDTMLTQGFGADIKYVLEKVFRAREAMYQRPARMLSSSSMHKASSPTPQLIMASATMTKAVRALLQHVDGFSTDLVVGKDMKSKHSNLNKPSERVTMNIAEISGVHHSLPNVTHRMIDTKGNDKLVVLDNIIQEMNKKVSKTMIFCNTIHACRAVAYFLDAQSTNEPCLSYHGSINSRDRARNMETFRGASSSTHPMFMVCSDIAARGLDIPGVDHVLMFDFPLNPIDYLHRAGRTGRPGQAGARAGGGLVTSIVAKRDRVLAQAIEGAIARKQPLDLLTSDKRDYQDKGKLAAVVGKRDQKDYQFSKEMARKKDGPRITLKRGSNKRLVSDPNRVGIYVKQPAQKTVSRTVSKRIAEINQKRGESLVRKRKKDLAAKKKFSS